MCGVDSDRSGSTADMKREEVSFFGCLCSSNCFYAFVELESCNMFVWVTTARSYEHRYTLSNIEDRSAADQVCFTFLACLKGAIAVSAVRVAVVDVAKLG